MTYFKLVQEVAERYELGADVVNEPWVRSYAIVDTEDGARLVIRKLDTWFYESESDLLKAIAQDEEINAALKRNVAGEYPELAKMSEIKTVFRGRLVVDGAFLSSVKEAVAKCRSFGEFGFSARRKFRKETIDRLGGNDRNLRDFVRWALRSH